MVWETTHYFSGVVLGTSRTARLSRTKRPKRHRRSWTKGSSAIVMHTIKIADISKVWVQLTWDACHIWWNGAVPSHALSHCQVLIVTSLTEWKLFLVLYTHNPTELCHKSTECLIWVLEFAFRMQRELQNLMQAESCLATMSLRRFTCVACSWKYTKYLVLMISVLMFSDRNMQIFEE